MIAFNLLLPRAGRDIGDGVVLAFEFAVGGDELMPAGGGGVFRQTFESVVIWPFFTLSAAVVRRSALPALVSPLAGGSLRVWSRRYEFTLRLALVECQGADVDLNGL